MKLIRILSHGFVLCTANVASIIIGFAAYYLLKPVNQIAIQVPIAAILSIVLFLIWTFLARIPPLKPIAVNSAREFAWVFIAALAWGPVIFLLLHFLIRGYVSGGGNLKSLLLFQLPVNLLAVSVAKNVIQRETKPDPSKASHLSEAKKRLNDHPFQDKGTNT